MSLEALEATALAEHLRASRWTYPLVNAGHIAGIAVLVGSVLPMNLRLLRLVPGPDPAAVRSFLRPFAVTGLVVTIVFGGLLFAAKAEDYAGNPWFLIKLSLLFLAIANAALQLRFGRERPRVARASAAASLLLWPLVLICGRMVGYN